VAHKVRLSFRRRRLYDRLDVLRFLSRYSANRFDRRRQRTRKRRERSPSSGCRERFPNLICAAMSSLPVVKAKHRARKIPYRYSVQFYLRDDSISISRSRNSSVRERGDLALRPIHRTRKISESRSPSRPDLYRKRCLRNSAVPRV